jgi:TonB family protein
MGSLGVVSLAFLLALQTPEPIKSGFGAGAYRITNGVIGPTPVTRVDPKYTAEAIQAQISGDVGVEVIVLADGSVGDVRVVKSLDKKYGLDDSALKAAREWKFLPGLVNAQAVPVVVPLTLVFRLFPGPRGPVPAYPVVQESVAEFRKGAYMPDTPGLIKPKLTSTKPPVYTRDAMRQKIQGDVELEGIVGTDGSLVKVRVTKSLDARYGLDDAAMHAAREWKFIPATFEGQAVPVVVTLVLSFRLH